MPKAAPSPVVRHKKTMMFDGLTRSRLDDLSIKLDTHQTDVFRRAVVLMHALILESEGRDAYLISQGGLRIKLDLDLGDNSDDAHKMTLKFNDETLRLVTELSKHLKIFPTYVFRRAVAIFSTLHTESANGQKVLLIDSISGEVETLRFF